MSTLFAQGNRLRHIGFAGDRWHGSAIDLAHRAAVRDPHAATTELSLEASVFLYWLFERAGLDIHSYRPDALKRRVAAVLRVTRAVSPAHARWLIERDRELLAAAIDSLVIGVSSFFRDAEVFERLRHLLPAVARGRPAARIWSAGCSNGQELYSVAILLAELGLLHRFDLLGTDCRTRAIDRAREGVYDAAAMGDVPADLLDCYFDRVGGRYRVRAWLRSCVQWRSADVTRVIEPGRWDLVLCRNMLMYLAPPTAARVSDRLQRVLNPGGLLVTGKAERPAGPRLIRLGPCIYRRCCRAGRSWEDR